jgi:MFS family permease
VWSAPRDADIILVSRFTRVFAYGSSTLIIALYFSVLGFADEQIGLFMTLTLLGDVLVSLVLALWADRLGRRRMLMLGGLMMAGSGVVFAITGNYWILLAAAILGVIIPGCVLESLCRHDCTIRWYAHSLQCEIGPFRAIEEFTLAQLITAEIRTDIFAW